MSRKVVTVSLAAGALAAAAAAGVVVVHKYRQNHPHTPADQEALDRIESYLDLATSSEPEHAKYVRLWNRFKQTGTSTEALRSMIAGLRDRTLSDDTTNVAEKVLDDVEDHAGRENL